MVGIYVRVSTVGQVGEDKESLPDQLRKGKAFAERLGLPFKEFIDIESGSKSERDDWQSLINNIKNNNLTIVWTPKTDRFGREIAEGLFAYKLMQKKKIKFFVGDEERPNDLGSLIKTTIELLMAEVEVENIKDRLLSKKIISMNKGNKRKPATYGYDAYYNDKGERRLKKNEEEEKVVKDIFRRFLAGESIRSIAIHLNNTMVPTKKGGKWRQTTIGPMLKRIEYSGWTTNYDKSKIIKSTMYDEIITKADFDRVQEIYDNLCNGRPHSNSRGKKISEYALSGVIRCAKCGAYYYFKTAYKNRKLNNYKNYYYTHDYTYAAGKGCTQLPKSINKDFLELQMKAFFFSIFLHPENSKRIMDKINVDTKDIETELTTTLGRIDKKVLEIDKSIMSLVKLAERGVDVAVNRILDLQDEKAKLIQDKEAIKTRIEEELGIKNKFMSMAVEEIKKMFELKDPKVIKGLFNKYFDGITIDGDIITFYVISGFAFQFNLFEPIDLKGQIEGTTSWK